MKNNRRNLAVLGVMVLVIGYVSAMLAYTVAVVLGADQSTLFTTARFIARTGLFYYRDFINMEAVGNFWVINSPELNQVYGVYPPGYPLLLAFAEWIGGLEYVVAAFCAVFSVVMMYSFARYFLSPYMSLLAAFILASSPVLFINAQLKNTHALGLALTLAGMNCLLWASRKRSVLSIFAMIICGLLLGYNVAVRYTEGLLLIVPVVFCLTAPQRVWGDKKLKYRRIAGYLAGTAIPLGLLGWYHYAAFGNPLKTGYSLFNATSNGFALAYFFDNLWLYIPGLFTNGLGPAMSLLFVALVGLKRHWRGKWFWFSWILPLFLLYHFYFWASPDNLHLMLRFYLNIFPAAIVCGLLGWRNFARRHRGLPLCGVAAVFTVTQFLWGVRATTPTAEGLFKGSHTVKRQIEYLIAKVPQNSWIFFTPTLENRKDAVFPDSWLEVQKWHLFSTDIFALENWVDELQRQVKEKGDLPDTFQGQRTKNLLNSSPDKILEEFLESVRRAAAKGTQFYFFGMSSSLEDFQETAGRYFVFGKPENFENFGPAYLMFPQGVRSHAFTPKSVAALPDLVLVPMRLKSPMTGK